LPEGVVYSPHWTYHRKGDFMANEGELVKYLKERDRRRLVTLIGVLVVTAIVIVAVFIAWSVYDFNERMDAHKNWADSLQHERNYQRFVDSLKHVENERKLEAYLKKHPNERPKKK
jgi:hypothetical protein